MLMCPYACACACARSCACTHVHTHTSTNTIHCKIGNKQKMSSVLKDAQSNMRQEKSPKMQLNSFCVDYLLLDIGPSRMCSLNVQQDSVGE